jgi:Raf kinase inhibitor-like YbhB/YbcL family protein
MKRFVILAACLLVPHEAFAMNISSPDIASGAAIAKAQAYRDCKGSNISPALNWSGVPKEAKSLVVTVHDRDVPGAFWHWIVYDIPPSATGLPQNAGSKKGTGLPAGAKQGRNSYGDLQYDGPCPPAGQPPHHYQFTVWGMSVKNADPTYVDNAVWFASYLHQHALAKAVFEGTYGR